MVKRLDAWLFDRGDPTSFGLFRILVGLCWVLNLLMIAPYWEDWFSEKGYVPAALGRQWLGENTTLNGFATPRLDLLGGITNPTLGLLFYVLVLIAAVGTMLGFWTRTSTILLALGAVSLHHRNPLILHGGDSVLRICALYVAVGPAGAALSLDQRYRTRHRSEGEETVLFSVWPQRLVAINVALIYLTTIWAKWMGSLWRDGMATWYTARLQEFERFPVPHFLIEPPMTVITTYSTVAIEFALGTLVFYRPLRNWVLLAGVLLHAGIEYSMNIPLFALAIVSMYVCFLDGEEVRSVLGRVRVCINRRGRSTGTSEMRHL